jgi:hypothetical protein
VKIDYTFDFKRFDGEDEIRSLLAFSGIQSNGNSRNPILAAHAAVPFAVMLDDKKMGQWRRWKTDNRARSLEQ